MKFVLYAPSFQSFRRNSNRSMHFRTLAELQNMRLNNKTLVAQLSKVVSNKSKAEKKFALLSDALEELKNLRASELYELDKQKRCLYGCKSERHSSLNESEEIDLKKDKDDFDGSPPVLVLPVHPLLQPKTTCNLRLISIVGFPASSCQAHPDVVITASVLLRWRLL